MKQIKLYESPGHAWAKVSKRELRQLQISHLISEYSYQSESGQFAYLEEDRDLGLYLAALRLNHVSYQIDTVHKDNEYFLSRWSRYDTALEHKLLSDVKELCAEMKQSNPELFNGSK